MFAVIVTQPMDVIKTKLSTQNWINSKFCCKEIENCTAESMQKELNIGLKNNIS